MILQEYLIKLKTMSPAKADEIAGFFEKESFDKNDLLVEEGKVSRKSYFLKSGIVRCYTHDLNGEEVTTRLYTAPEFVNDYLSFFREEPSQENYQALTDLEVWSINLENVQHCFHTIPEFREWGRMMLTMNYVNLHKRMLSFHKYTAQERYLQLMEQHPEVIQQVPLKIIASYLGVTKFSLSRIRKEIVQH